MLDKETILYRLSLIKYIYENGQNECNKPEPLCVGSLLMFHDSIELFLHLIFEHLDIKTKNNKPFFSDYWDLIDGKIPERKLTQKESMNRLNDARKAFKHHGIIPSKLALDEFQRITKSFFEENCKEYFDIDFSKITLIELIGDSEIKKYLKDATIEMDDGNMIKAIELVATAFDFMLIKYEENKLTKFGTSVFQFSDTIHFSKHHIKTSSDRNTNMPAEIYRFIDDTIKEFSNIRKTIKIIGFGIDFRKYSIFKHIIPYVFRMLGGKIEFQYKREGDKDYKREEIEYCINFCIESYLKLISFNFEVK